MNSLGSRTVPTGTKEKQLEQGPGWFGFTGEHQPERRSQSSCPASTSHSQGSSPELHRGNATSTNIHLWFISSPEVNQHENGKERTLQAPAEPQHCLTRVKPQPGTAPSTGQGQISTRSPGTAAGFQESGKAGECGGCPAQPRPPAWLPGAAVCRNIRASCSPEPAQLCKRADVGGEGIKKAPGGAGGGSA